MRERLVALGALTMLAAANPVSAQEASGGRRLRIGLGPQLVPSFPGAKDVSLRPLIDVSRARPGEPYEFEAPDESAGFPLLRSNGFAIGPSLNFEGRREAEDVGGALPSVDVTIEAGGFVQYAVHRSIRVRAEARRGLGGHEGWVGAVGADYLVRGSNDLLFSAGPRVTLADAAYHRAYFGVAAADAPASGLRPFRPGAGVQAVGGTVGLVRQFSPRWGIYGYGKYDRLVGDAARSPVTRAYGARDQLSGGLALTYTFFRKR